MSGRTIRTIQGETWDEIARRLNWPEQYMDRLMSANPAHIGTVFFDAGVELNVPAVKIQTDPVELPPWA